MNLIQQTLSACALFRGLTPEQLAEISAQAHFITRSYKRDQVVAFEEDECSALGIVAAGRIHIQRIFPSGKLITIETFQAGSSFGDALIFADSNKYPATLIATEETQVLFLPRADVAQLCLRYPVFQLNFLRGLSNRILMLNGKIKSLSFGSLRQRVANYLLEEHHRQQSAVLIITRARHELASALGIPRPSLSRELMALKAEGWIDFDRRTITIHDLDALEHCLRV